MARRRAVARYPEDRLIFYFSQEFSVCLCLCKWFFWLMNGMVSGERGNEMVNFGLGYLMVMVL